MFFISMFSKGGQVDRPADKTQAAHIFNDAWIDKRRAVTRAHNSSQVHFMLGAWVDGSIEHNVNVF